MTDEDKTLAFWLIPAEPIHGRFAAIIEQLATRFDAPVFEPHLTLYGTPFRAADTLEALDQITLPEFIELKPSGIAFSEKFTKTLFVEFEPTDALLELRDAFARALHGENEATLEPHVSLIYGRLPNETKAELARSLWIPFETVRFSAMKAIVTPSVIESREPVEAWRTIWERSFA